MENQGYNPNSQYGQMSAPPVPSYPGPGSYQPYATSYAGAAATQGGGGASAGMYPMQPLDQRFQPARDQSPGGFRQRGRGGRPQNGGQRRSNSQNRKKPKAEPKEPPKPAVKQIKPVKAAEIKSFLYAWCGQRKMKPEYDCEQIGIQPEIKFRCKLDIKGIEHSEKVEAQNKKDAQSKAAWNFADELVKRGMIKESELPPRPIAPALGTTPVAGNKLIKETKETAEEIFAHGGWTLQNARQRLNQFCQREHCNPDFQHYTTGAEHCRTFICALTLQVYNVQKEYTCRERGTNKKQATALASLGMVRKLFAEGLIERAGEAIKALEPERNFSEFAAPIPVMTADIKPKGPSQGQMKAAQKGKGAEANLKRKAAPESEGDLDENGNWTLENSRQRLFQYCQTNSLPCEYVFTEEGSGITRSYTASIALETNDKKISGAGKASTKKSAAQTCAHDALVQLYKLNLVEANVPVSRKKSLKQEVMDIDLQREGYIHPIRAGPATKTSLILDQYVNKKHKEIYPTDDDLVSMREAVRRTELALKMTAEELKANNKANPEESVLQGVVRVGALAKGLVLRDDLNVELVLVCVKAPTKSTYNDVAKILGKRLKGSVVKFQRSMKDASLMLHFSQEKPDPEDATKAADSAAKDQKMESEQSIKEEKTDKEEKDMSDWKGGKLEATIKSPVSITVYFTSTVIRSIKEEENQLPADALDRTGCLKALAELRHAKWFQACASVLPNCIVIMRVLRHLTRTMKEWRALDDWTMELLTARLFKSSLSPSPPLGSSLQRVFECIASGVFLPGGPGILDPCEKDPTDTTSHMGEQAREDITAAAQLAVRQFVFRKPYLVLGMEEIQK